MKPRILKHPKDIKRGKVIYKTKRYIRAYLKPDHPEEYVDMPIDSQAETEANLFYVKAYCGVNCHSYQYYDILTATKDNIPMLSSPRNFTKLTIT
jgi:hypothetical protein